MARLSLHKRTATLGFNGWPIPRPSSQGGAGSFRPPSCELEGLATLLWRQSVARASRTLVSQNRVGASRRSAAPGSQSVGAAGHGSFLNLRVQTEVSVEKCR